MTSDILNIVGNGANKVLIFDDFMLEPQKVIKAACELSPFPHAPKEVYYPGLRLTILPEMSDAASYIGAIYNSILPIMSHFHGAKSMEIVDCNFSMVTDRPEELHLYQTAPHFDSLDENHFAILHYLSPNHNSGTSIYRHNSTGFEQINNNNIDTFMQKYNEELYNSHREKKYMNGSDEFYTEIFRVDGKFNRLAIYQGSLLHSGNIYENENLSSDPLVGRLTSNIFIRIKK